MSLFFLDSESPPLSHPSPSPLCVFGQIIFAESFVTQKWCSLLHKSSLSTVENTLMDSNVAPKLNSGPDGELEICLHVCIFFILLKLWWWWLSLSQAGRNQQSVAIKVALKSWAPPSPRWELWVHFCGHGVCLLWPWISAPSFRLLCVLADFVTQAYQLIQSILLGHVEHAL